MVIQRYAAKNSLKFCKQRRRVGKRIGYDGSYRDLVVPPASFRFVPTMFIPVSSTVTFDEEVLTERKQVNGDGEALRMADCSSM